MNNKKVTCSFEIDRDIYNKYKDIISKNGEDIKENLVRYMKAVIDFNSLNSETLFAIQEVQELRKDPNKKVYNSFSEILEELYD